MNKRIIKIRSSISRIICKTHTFFLSGSYNSIGNNTIVYRKAKIINYVKSGVKIGENCLIGQSTLGYHAGMPFHTTLLNDGENSHISIGNNCRINGAYIHSKDFITIGDDCVIAAGVSIIDSNGHQLNSTNRTKGRDKAEGITIGNNVWIGLNAIIMKGTVIEDNCVVGAGSVVKGHFAASSIIQGNPAVSRGIMAQ